MQGTINGLQNICRQKETKRRGHGVKELLCRNKKSHKVAERDTSCWVREIEWWKRSNVLCFRVGISLLLKLYLQVLILLFSDKNIAGHTSGHTTYVVEGQKKTLLCCWKHFYRTTAENLMGILVFLHLGFMWINMDVWRIHTCQRIWNWSREQSYHHQ